MTTVSDKAVDRTVGHGPADPGSTSTGRAPIRLAVFLRDRLLRDAVSEYLAARTGLLLVGTVATVEELRLVCDRRRPDVALVDVAALLSSPSTARQVRAASWHTELLGLTATELSPEELVEVKSGGVSRILSTSDGMDAVLEAISDQAGAAGRQGPGVPHLTSQETVIIFLLGAGHSTPEIARLLDLRPRTVENHKRHIYEKLGVGSQSSAVARAISLGLLRELDKPQLRGEPGRSPLVLVHGPAGECRDEVVRTLVCERLPFVTIWQRDALARDHWARWNRGQILVVLIDPEPDDWSLPASLHAPTVVVRGCHVRDQLAMVDALARQASALIAREDIATTLGPALHMAAAGLFGMSWLYTTVLSSWAPPPVVVPELTARERDILDSIAAGHTIRQTARTLGIAAKTVENTQARLFRKLGARNRTDALTIASGWGLVDGVTPQNGSAPAGASNTEPW